LSVKLKKLIPVLLLQLFLLYSDREPAYGNAGQVHRSQRNGLASCK